MAPTKKTKTTKKVSSKKTTSSKAFPTRVLKSWLKDKTSWNHNEWLALLDELNKKGYEDHISTPEGRDKVGMYLEENK